MQHLFIADSIRDMERELPSTGPSALIRGVWAETRYQYGKPPEFATDAERRAFWKKAGDLIDCLCGF